MSKFVKVRTELRDLNLIKRALSDLQLGWKENARYTHVFSGHTEIAPLVIKTGHVQFALRATPDGIYEAAGDDMHMKGIRAALEQVQQRYAYHMVLAETAKAGFELVEEQTGRDHVIRMTVRRWS
jgi:hypothetical protein